MKKMRIMLFVLLLVMLGYGIDLWLTVSSIQNKGTQDIRKYQEMVIANVKQYLKNHVDIAYTVMESNYNNSLYKTPEGKTYLENFYGHSLENIIDLVEVILKSKAKQVDDGKLSLEKAQEQAKVEIKQLRYDNGTGYIWINDTGKPYPKMIMHPTLPSLVDGKILNDPSFNTAFGGKKNLFVAFVEVCENKGEGYVNYSWPKPLPDGLTHEKPKLSYVRLFKEWNWIIGTGVYIDDAIEDGKTKTLNDLKQMRYDDGVGYFWINDTTKPTPRIIMHPTKPELDGQILNDPKYNTTLGKYTDVKKGQNIVEAQAEVCETQGSGYVDYEWPKPTENGLTKPQPKMSYVKLYEPLGWIVGSGVYIDDIENEMRKREKAIDKQTMSLIVQELAIPILIIILTMVILYFVLKKYLPNQKEVVHF